MLNSFARLSWFGRLIVVIVISTVGGLLGQYIGNGASIVYFVTVFLYVVAYFPDYNELQAKLMKGFILALLGSVGAIGAPILAMRLCNILPSGGDRQTYLQLLAAAIILALGIAFTGFFKIIRAVLTYQPADN